MPILLTRIDDRLIHGQVVVGWAQSLKANHIVVINNEIVTNDMQKFLFRMATPSEIKLSVLSVVEAAEKLKRREFDDDDTIILVKAPADIYEVLKKGGKIGELNIGGMHFAHDKIQLFDAIYVDDGEIEILKAINKMGVKLEVRMVPKDSKKDIIKAIEEKYDKKKEKESRENGN